MLALVRHASWRAAGGYKKWHKAHFAPSSTLVHPHVEAELAAELRSCFLHTPPSVIFAQREPARTLTPIACSEVEQVAYNYVLSLHQRDVVRAGAGAIKPAEWTRKTDRPDWRQRGKSSEAELLKEASAEKTINELLCAANGGEVRRSMRRDASRNHACAVAVAVAWLRWRGCGGVVAGLPTRVCSRP
jgi:hypothetical protein